MSRTLLHDLSNIFKFKHGHVHLRPLSRGRDLSSSQSQAHLLQYPEVPPRGSHLLIQAALLPHLNPHQSRLPLAFLPDHSGKVHLPLPNTLPHPVERQPARLLSHAQF